MGSVGYYFVRATNVIIICTSYCHLRITVQLICTADGTAVCHTSVPGLFFFPAFLVPSCGKFLNSCFKSATQNWKPPSCEGGSGREQHPNASASWSNCPQNDGPVCLPNTPALFHSSLSSLRGVQSRPAAGICGSFALHCLRPMSICAASSCCCHPALIPSSECRSSSTVSGRCTKPINASAWSAHSSYVL